ncbi:MAG: saccharopine dehydrogenase family protein [Candidatus Rokuibacteriota bacterium]
MARNAGSRPYLVYGANGYTGRLIARYARERGHQPILAGRNARAVEALASELGLQTRLFDLGSPVALDRGLADVRAVLLCAGPFANTSRPMVDACLRNRVTYLDITGEVSVFEACAARDAEARDAGVMLMPGAGFDVVPSDCLAVHLKQRLPTATELSLAISGLTQASHGTAATMIESVHRGGLVRRGGVLTPVAPRWRSGIGAASSISGAARRPPSPFHGEMCRRPTARPGSPTSRYTWRCPGLYAPVSHLPG